MQAEGLLGPAPVPVLIPPFTSIGAGPQACKGGATPPRASASAWCFLASAAPVAPPAGDLPYSACVFLTGMKPPPRRRAAPARYLGEVTGPATWSAREKRQLVRLLQARQGQPEPDAAELARELQGRSEAEVRCGSRDQNQAGDGARVGRRVGGAAAGAGGAGPGM